MTGERRAVALSAISLVAAFGVTGSAFGASFTNPAPIDSGDGSIGSPYPSQIGIGPMGPIAGIRVTLNNVTHTFPDDLKVLVVGPNGRGVGLMDNVGGGSPGITSQTLVFDDGGNPISDEGAPSTGTYRPTSGQAGTSELSFAPPAPNGPYLYSLNQGFMGSSPAGTWSLYVLDDEEFDTGTIAGGWTLDVTPANTFTAGRVLRKKNGSAQLEVNVPGPGVVTVAKSKTVRGASVSTTGGRVLVPIKARGKGAKKLKKKKKLTTGVLVSYLPNGGTSNGTSKTVTLKIKKKKKK